MTRDRRLGKVVLAEKLGDFAVEEAAAATLRRVALDEKLNQLVLGGQLLCVAPLRASAASSRERPCTFSADLSKWYIGIPRNGSVLRTVRGLAWRVWGLDGTPGAARECGMTQSQRVCAWAAMFLAAGGTASASPAKSAIGILVFDGFLTSDVTAPVEVFGAATKRAHSPHMRSRVAAEPGSRGSPTASVGRPRLAHPVPGNRRRLQGRAAARAL